MDKRATDISNQFVITKTDKWPPQKTMLEITETIKNSSLRLQDLQIGLACLCLTVALIIVSYDIQGNGYFDIFFSGLFSIAWMIALFFFIKKTFSYLSISINEKKLISENVSNEKNLAKETYISYNNKANALFETIHYLQPEINIKISELNLVLKEMTIEYQDRAYSPFWEKVEEFLIKMDHIIKGIDFLQINIKDFNELVSNKENNFPAINFTVQVEEFNQLLQEFRQKKRVADKDHEFAVIWEHFKDRQVMLLGFKSIKQAIDNLGIVLSNAIYSVGEAIESRLSNIESHTSDTVMYMQEQVDLQEESAKTLKNNAKLLRELA